jgi:transcription initiation factor IIE alpha subunit
MATYTCPKHPDVHMNQPGNCPKCGARLEQRDQREATKPQPGSAR